MSPMEINIIFGINTKILDSSADGREGTNLDTLSGFYLAIRVGPN